MVVAGQLLPRVTVDGKFFRLGAKKFFPKGVTYGPFAPSPETGSFASREQTEQDFLQILELGANLVRVYYVPPPWFLDLAGQHQLHVLVDVPWHKHLCFLDSQSSQQQARGVMRQAVTECQGHPALFALSLVNEIPPEVARWSGARATERFIEELIDEAKSLDPGGLYTFTNFPPTEFLRPQNIDFLCFNLYLHDPRAFSNYLARLQMLADSKPLVLAEFGMDSIRQGEAHKCEFLAGQIEWGCRGGVAGTIVFSYTDDWFRGGLQIDDWAFGLTTRDRQPKASFKVVQQSYACAPIFPLVRTPRVSVVVASFNGGRTLAACLESLGRLNYPNFEVILVDDGSTDTTPEIARQFPLVRYLRQENCGLSAARNVGIAAATGEIVAFTDSDCRADEDWLYYLIGDLLNGDFVGIGGHNFLPPEDSPVAAAVMASPGGPAHVMLTDREAEHIPGCNMAFYKWALDDIGGFDPIFRKAGDDVDVCWRLQQRGGKIGFSSAGFVWHFRRSTVKAYLRQQAGYGEAEALLASKHPEHFNSIGLSIWRGRIYSASKSGVVLGRSVIYHGLFGSGFFQQLYASGPSPALMLCTSLEYYMLLCGPLAIASILLPLLWPLPVASFLIPLAVCMTAAAQADLPTPKRRWWSRPLIGLLFLLQPLERGLARYRSGLMARPGPRRTEAALPVSKTSRAHTGNLCFWSEGRVDRYKFLQTILKMLDRQNWPAKLDTGWDRFDAEVFGNRWVTLRLVTATEQLDQGRLSIRCRRETSWSLSALVLLWGLLGVEVVAAWLLAPIQPWIWMLLLSIPLLCAWLDHQAFELESAIAQLLDQAADQLQLLHVDPVTN